MKPTTRNPHDVETGQSAISSADLFAAFANERRQHTLIYLAQKSAAIPLGDLAEYIALKEGEPSYDWYERILTDLYHHHLPYLTDAGLVSYDADSELVTLAVERTVVAPYLRLVGRGDS